MEKDPYGFYPIYTNTVDYTQEANPDALFADGLESACIGHTEIWEKHPEGGASRRTLVVYSKQKIMKHLIENEGMDSNDAEEYAEYNIYSAYMGENTPLYVDETYYVNL